MKKLLFIAVVVLILAFIVASSVHLEKDSGNILVDASKPQRIVWPCEVDIVGENGEKAFVIGPEVDQGWRNRKWNEQEGDVDIVRKDGFAIYHFYVPCEGDYVIWGYVLWDDPCTNAVYVKIDEGNDAVLGNDPVYKEWHWVRGNSMYLSKGSHTLTLSNHSNNVALQKIMFIGSEYKMPAECENYFTDIFYDDFDGCDLGNFYQWDNISGSWYVSNYDKLACTNNNSLIGESIAESSSEIQVDGNQWENYSFDIDVSVKQYNQGAFAQIRFGIDTEDGSFAIKIIPHSQGKTRMQLLKLEDGVEVVLGESDTDKETFKISLNMDEKMDLLLDDDIIITNNHQLSKGGIRLLLEGEIIVCFDNLHIRYLEALQLK